MEVNVAPPTLLQRLREAIRARHYSIRTEEAYAFWVRRYILFHRKRHPSDMGEAEVREFLTHLATHHEVAASTQNQALNALIFLYRYVLERPLGDLGEVVRAKRPQRLPVVLTVDEVGRVLQGLPGVYWLIGCLQYGSGLRLLESVRLRVKDLDFGHRAIVVRDGKGAKDRIVTLSDELIVPLRRHLLARRTTFERDRAAGHSGVFLPHALARKYPNAPFEWGWQYVFAAAQHSTDPRSGEKRRHHVDESSMQKAMRAAVLKAGIVKPASCHTPLLRDASPRTRRGHPHGAGAARSRRCAHHADLYARAEARWDGSGKSARRRAANSLPGQDAAMRTSASAAHGAGLRKGHGRPMTSRTA